MAKMCRGGAAEVVQQRIEAYNAVETKTVDTVKI